MKKLITFAAFFLSVLPAVQGSENSLVTIYQPLFLKDDSPPVACAVPFVTGGPYPEIFFDAITRPHPPQGNSPHMDGDGDVNAASGSGIALRCEMGGKERILIFDFTKADPKLVDKDLIKALLDCVDMTKGKNLTYRSRILGGERFSEAIKTIQERIPAETSNEQKEEPNKAAQTDGDKPKK